MRKKLANVCQHKNICIPILNMYTNVCDICKLLKTFNWLNWLYNIVRVMRFNESYEFF